MNAILIILMGSIGDVARGLAIVPVLRTNYPGAKISWLVEPKSKPLLEFATGIDEIITFERGQGIPALLKLKKDLESRSFDLTLDLQRHFKSGFFSWLSAAPRRIGFNRQDAKEFNWIFQTETINAFGDGLPKIEHYLKFTEHLGVKVPSSLHFEISELKTKESLPLILRPMVGNFVAVVLGSAWRSKDWLPDGYLELIKQLLVEHADSIVLVGDRGTVGTAEAIVKSTGSERVINLAGMTSLTELIAIMGSANYGIGPDSGPGHIAAMFGVKYIALFGPTDPVRTAPYGSEHLAVSSHVACSPCYRRICPGLGGICMRLISPHAVLDKIAEMDGRVERRL